MLGLSLGISFRPYDRSAIQQMLDALRRNNGSLWYVPDDYGLTMGQELFPQPDLDSANGLSLGAGWSISGGVATLNGGAGSLTDAANFAAYATGKMYRVTVEISSKVSGGTFQVYLRGAVVATSGLAAVGTFTFPAVAGTSATEGLTIIGLSSCVGAISRISVREVINATVFQDNAGTTPVTAVGDLIGLITDKSYGGQLGVPSLRALAQGGETLRDTGVLMASITHALIGTDAVEYGTDAVEYGTNVPYAMPLHYGATIRAVNSPFLMFRIAGGGFVRKKEVTLPVREFLGVSTEDEEQVIELINNFLKAG